MRGRFESGNVARVTTTRGQDAAARIERMGISNIEFASRAKVDRGTLVRAMRDDERISPKTWARIETALGRLERELGMDMPEPIGNPADDLVEFEVTGNFGVRAVVRGPVRDLPALQEAVSRIVADMQASGGEVRDAD